MYVVWHSDLDQGPLSILSYVCESFAKYLVIVLYFCKHEEIKVGYATQRIWWSLDRYKEEVSICGGGEEKNNKFTQRLKWTQYENITFWADDDNLRGSIQGPAYFHLDGGRDLQGLLWSTTLVGLFDSSSLENREFSSIEHFLQPDH